VDKGVTLGNEKEPQVEFWIARFDLHGGVVPVDSLEKIPEGEHTILDEGKPARMKERK